MTADNARADLDARCNTIEEAYEFMLAYASQGLSEEGGRIREYLSNCDTALSGLAQAFSDQVERLGLQPTEPYRAFLDVLGRDARDAQAAIRLALAQRVIGSQLVDNLNASIHLRALLTDLFLVDEILKGQT